MPTEGNLRELVPLGHPWGYGADHGSEGPDTEARLRTIPGSIPDESADGPPYTRDMSALDASLPLPLPATGDEAAVRDAEKIADRIARDEAAATQARQAYQADGLPVIEADGAGAFLQPGETLHAVHGSALLEDAGWADRAAHPRGGTLYLTSERLVHTGVESSELSLAAIDEMGIALERLVLIRLRDGSDMAIEVDQPRLLRVQLAAAIAAQRARETALS